MGQLHAASKDVAAGSQQVANGATALSQGSTEQAAEVDGLASHISAFLTVYIKSPRAHKKPAPFLRN